MGLLRPSGLGRRLRILLVPDLLSWILGTWAKQIARLGTSHDYYFFSTQMLPQYPNEWKALTQSVDVIHILDHWDAGQLTLPQDLPIITTIHHVVDWEELVPLTKADAVIVVASEWREYLETRGVPPGRIFMFHNGVDYTRFYPCHNRMQAKRKFGICPETFTVGYSAKFSSDHRGRKGIDIFLEAIRIVADAGHPLSVLITGPGWDRIVGEIQSYGVEVCYCPFVSEEVMVDVYNALDAYVVTSRIEGGPVTLLESMACGVPVVTTPVGIALDCIADGVNGLVVPKDDAQATAQAITRLIASPALCSQLGKAGMETASQNLTWEKTLAGIEELYTQVWQSRSVDSQHRTIQSVIEPAKQRQWALSVDSHLWYQWLYERGYRWESLCGMLKNSLRASGRLRPELLKDSLFAAWRISARPILQRVWWRLAATH